MAGASPYTILKEIHKQSLKRGRESFWHQKGTESAPLTSVSKGAIYILISYYNKSKECLKFVEILPDPLPQFMF